MSTNFQPKIGESRGFTLVELLVALSLFMVVMTIAMGSVLSIFDDNRKTQSESAVMNNLNLAVESMAREIRFGTNYHCDSIGVLTEPLNCGSGDSYMAFLSSDGEEIVYKQLGSAIMKSTDGGATFIAITAPEVSVEALTFYVLGAQPPPDGGQPRVVLTIKGHSGEKADTRTAFSLQTLVSQRHIDNGQ